MVACLATCAAVLVATFLGYCAGIVASKRSRSRDMTACHERGVRVGARQALVFDRRRVFDSGKVTVDQPSKVVPSCRPVSLAERLRYCRSQLDSYGFLTELESLEIGERVDAWVSGAFSAVSDAGLVDDGSRRVEERTGEDGEEKEREG